MQNLFLRNSLLICFQFCDVKFSPRVFIKYEAMFKGCCTCLCQAFPKFLNREFIGLCFAEIFHGLFSMSQAIF